MAVELVTGHAGTGHIDGFDVGGLIGGLAGDGDYVLQEPYGTISCTVKDNNHVVIGKGDLIMSGRHVRIEDPETLTVQSGTQGQQRHDLVVMRYNRQSSGIETAELQVLRGTPGSSSTPWYNTGSILNGSTTRDMPLYRLDLNGISLSTSPARLYSTLTPVSAIMPNVGKQISNVTNRINQEINTIRSEQVKRQNGDTANAHSIQSVKRSLTQFQQNFDVLQFGKLCGDDDWVFQGVVINGVAMISGRWTNRNTFNNPAWGKWDVARITNGWKAKDEYGAWSIDSGREGDGWFSIVGDTISYRSRSQHDVYAGIWHYVTLIAPMQKN